NWYAVSTTTNGNKNLCPDGWHVPTYTEFTNLINWLVSDGGVTYGQAGFALKASSTDPLPWDGTNTFGFTALPTGFRSSSGSFSYLGQSAPFWYSSEYGNPMYPFFLSITTSSVNNYDYGQNAGLAVRCLKN
ncbi:MAG TPA: FISUMP domain-containing protein, partial [bacterium]|nr:FISUMP domain-containing protein [bacterium]